MHAPFKNLRLPVIAAPLFIISTPALVIAQCKAGIVGSMPALNARPPELLDDWLAEITEALAAHDRAHPEAPAAPFADQPDRAQEQRPARRDMALCAKYKVPIVITSLGARADINEAVHGWGGIVLHDVIDDRYARKAVEKGADGLVAVAAGAGGHAGTTSPFALLQEIRRWHRGPLALSGAIANRRRGARDAGRRGADFAYIGSAFIATREAHAVDSYKQMVVNGSSRDIVYSNLFTGVHGNYLRGSIVGGRARPRRAAGERRQRDELRHRPQEAVEGHLGLRPGHRRDRCRAAGGRPGGSAGARVPRGAAAAEARERCARLNEIGGERSLPMRAAAARPAPAPA